jgi:hypothetical protein
MMMPYGHLLRVMGLSGRSHSLFEPEQLLDEIMKGIQAARVYSGNGAGVSRVSLVEVRVEVEV